MVKRSNWALLGGLRFFLAVVVFSYHAAFYTSTSGPNRWACWPQNFGGETAVIAFFLISGYSIAHSITNKPQGFYQRRVDRIYPLFFAAFLFALIPLVLGAFWPSRAVVEPPPSVASFLLNAFPVQTWLVKALHANGVTWSLGVECGFYALAPWFLRSSKKLLWWLFGVSVFFHYNATWFGIHAYGDGNTPIIGLACLWAWLLGWFMYIEQESTWVQRLGVGIATAIYCMNTRSDYTFATFTVVLTSGILVYQNEIALSPRTAKTLNYLGELSYPLYLFHFPIISIACMFFKEIPVVPTFAASIAVSMLAYHAIDKPYRRKKCVRPEPTPDEIALTVA